MDFEDRGIPVVTMVTQPFVTLARTIGKARGRESPAMVVLPYTIVNMSGEEARELADKFFEDIVNELTKRR
ncbi:hypothetical protein ACFLTG_03455 [Chloroflexota bacterium]